MKRTICGVLAVVLGAATIVISGASPGAADTTPVPFTCDLPAAQGGLAAGLIPDTVALDNDLTIDDSPDPVAPGGTVHYDLDVPFPDLTGDLPDVGFALGYFYLRSIDITQPIPAGLDLNSVQATLSPDPSWASVSRQGSNLVIHVQSAYPTVNDTNGRIRINADVTPTTIEVQETNGTWVPIDFIPSVDIDATVTGAAGSTIDWRPPSINAKVFYKKFIIFVINIDWNDVNTPCTPDDPNQTVVSTLVGSPALSVTTSADETSVVAGDDIHLHVTVTNTGNMDLTGVTVTDPNAPGCAGTPGNLAVGAQVTLDCTVTTTVGDVPTFSNTATADSNETAPVGSNTVDVTVTAPGPSGIAGTVTEAGTGTPLPGAWVAALRTSDFSVAAGAPADGSGNYSAEVPPGSYFVYSIDPTGTHTAGFFGAPTVVDVTEGVVADADPALAPLRGSVAGTVTEQGSGTPIADPLVISLDGTTAGPEVATVGDGTGQFSLDGLTSGNHFVGFVDPAGAHVSQFWPNSPNVPDATPVAVAAGAATAADAALPTKPVDPGGSTLSGTVTDSDSGAPLDDVSVVALHAADYSMARATTTDAAGDYSLDVSAGDYKLVFLDQSGTHDMEWFDGHPYFELGSADSVTAPTVADVGLDPNTGTLAGTVTDDPSGDPIEGAWVVAIGPTGIAGGAVTAADGTYTIPGLPAGTYRATVADPNGGRVQEFWPNGADFSAATPFAIAAGATTTIDEDLALP